MLNWTLSLSNKSFRREFLLSITLLLAVLCGFFFVLEYIEQRKGFVIEKGWMDVFCKPYDLSNYIFPLTWPVALVGVIFCFRKPELTLLLIRTYALLMIFRAITLLCVPLDPPMGIIHLNDPFLHHTFYQERQNLKDLFFSGHVATITLFALILPDKKMKFAFGSIAIVLGILIAIQRVHYIIDIVSAPLFAFAAFYLAKKWSAKIVRAMNETP